MAGELEYNKTAGSNAAINGIAILGSSSIKYGNDAIQQLMADQASALTRHVVKVAGSYTALSADYNQFWRATGAVTVNLTAAATLTDGWRLWVKADGGAVTVDPNGAELINGAATLTVNNGSSALIICTGTDFFAIVLGDVTSTGSFGGGYKLADVLLTSGNLTGTNVDLVLTPYIAAGYSRFRIQYKGWQGSADGAILKLQVSVNTGSSFVATGYGGNVIYGIGLGGSLICASIGATGFECSTATGNVAGELTYGQVYIERRPAVAAVYGQGHGTTQTPAHITFVTGGYVVQGNIDALRLTPTSGTHAAGVYSLYGIQDS